MILDNVYLNNDDNTDVEQLIDKMQSAHKTWINEKNSSRKENTNKKCRGHVQYALKPMKESWCSFREAADRKNFKAPAKCNGTSRGLFNHQCLKPEYCYASVSLFLQTMLH